jgi:hypothetical protein
MDSTDLNEKLKKGNGVTTINAPCNNFIILRGLREMTLIKRNTPRPVGQA